MYVSATKAGAILDSLSTREKNKERGSTLLTSDHAGSAGTGHTETESVSIALSQAAVNALNGSTSQNTPASLQLAMSRMDQIIRSGNSAAKADAGVRVENLKAQMRQLMEMKAFMSPKALAAAMAQMARELAAAVSEYVQNGGATANAAIGTVLLSTPASTSDDTQTETSSTISQTAQTTVSEQNDIDIQQTEQPTAADNSSSVTGQTTTEGKAKISGDDSDLFEKDVHSLADQIKAILQESRNRLKKMNISSDSDIQNAQDALDTVDQLISKI
jgi:hypothetical protein